MFGGVLYNDTYNELLQLVMLMTDTLSVPVASIRRRTCQSPGVDNGVMMLPT